MKVLGTLVGHVESLAFGWAVGRVRARMLRAADAGPLTSSRLLDATPGVSGPLRLYVHEALLPTQIQGELLEDAR